MQESYRRPLTVGMHEITHSSVLSFYLWPCSFLEKKDEVFGWGLPAFCRSPSSGPQDSFPRFRANLKHRTQTVFSKMNTEETMIIAVVLVTPWIIIFGIYHTIQCGMGNLVFQGRCEDFIYSFRSFILFPCLEGLWNIFMILNYIGCFLSQR